MGKHELVAQTTQTEHPWQTVVRGIFQALVALAAAAPLIYAAFTQQDPALAAGGVGTVLTIMAGVTRVMALPAVETFLQRFVPWLAAAPGDLERKEDQALEQNIRSKSLKDLSEPRTPPEQ